MAELAQKNAASPTATSVQSKGNVQATPRRVVFLHSLFFVLGFTIVFTLTGAAFGLFGRSLDQHLLMQVGAVVLTIFALATLGVFRFLVRWLSQRMDVNNNPAAAALVSVLDFPNKLL